MYVTLTFGPPPANAGCWCREPPCS
jgi:hypothetical protein